MSTVSTHTHRTAQDRDQGRLFEYRLLYKQFLYRLIAVGVASAPRVRFPVWPAAWRLLHCWRGRFVGDISAARGGARRSRVQLQTDSLFFAARSARAPGVRSTTRRDTTRADRDPTAIRSALFAISQRQRIPDPVTLDIVPPRRDPRRALAPPPSIYLRRALELSCGAEEGRLPLAEPGCGSLRRGLVSRLAISLLMALVTSVRTAVTS